MGYASSLIKQRPDSEDQVAHRRSVIASRLEVAVASLQDEEVQIASWFKIEIENKSICYGI